MGGNGMDRDGRGAEFTTFQIPERLVEVSLILLGVVVVLHTLWDAATAGGAFSGEPGPMRGVVVVGVGYLAIRTTRAGVRYWRKYGRRRIGPDIERIEPR